MNEPARFVFQYHGGDRRPRHPVAAFFALWGVTTMTLWVASVVFPGSIQFADAQTLLVSALLLGFANTILKPIMLVLTLPITVVTLGLFLLVINASMLLLVAWLVPGFFLAGFWTACGIALFNSVFGMLLNGLLRW